MARASSRRRAKVPASVLEATLRLQRVERRRCSNLFQKKVQKKPQQKSHPLTSRKTHFPLAVPWSHLGSPWRKAPDGRSRQDRSRHGVDKPEALRPSWKVMHVLLWAVLNARNEAELEKFRSVRVNHQVDLSNQFPSLITPSVSEKRVNRTFHLYNLYLGCPRFAGDPPFLGRASRPQLLVSTHPTRVSQPRSASASGSARTPRLPMSSLLKIWSSESIGSGDEGRFESRSFTRRWERR